MRFVLFIRCKKQAHPFCFNEIRTFYLIFTQLPLSMSMIETDDCLSSTEFQSNKNSFKNVISFSCIYHIDIKSICDHTFNAIAFRIEIEIEIMRWWDSYANEIEINFLCQYLFGPINFNMDFWSKFTFKIVTELFKYSHSSELWCKRICIKNL